jgi:hypothetical protein
MNPSNLLPKSVVFSLLLSVAVSVGAQTAASAVGKQSADSAAKVAQPIPAVPVAATPVSAGTAAPASGVSAAASAPAAPAIVPAAQAATPAATSSPVAPAPIVKANPVAIPDKSGEPSLDMDAGNTTIEGIQISHEPGNGNKPDEVVVSGYFIFKEKPVSYFYEVRQKEKKIIFEFNDTRAPETPIPSVAEPPIQKFTVEQHRIDVNKDVKGLKPEYHNQVRVTLFLDNIPDIHVNDQANVILFSYKWSTDPRKVGSYVLKSSSNGWIKYAVGGAVVVGVGAALGLKGGSSSGGSAISTSDLPVHPAQ